jgi:hypothetical protein
MKRIIDDASLPEPVSLTPEQLAAVASDTSAMLGAGGGLMVLIYGGDLLRAAVSGASISNGFGGQAFNPASVGGLQAGGLTAGM